MEFPSLYFFGWKNHHRKDERKRFKRTGTHFSSPSAAFKPSVFSDASEKVRMLEELRKRAEERRKKMEEQFWQLVIGFVYIFGEYVFFSRRKVLGFLY